MFRALLANLQEALHKHQLVYCLRVMSVGCHQDWNGTGVRHQFHSDSGSSNIPIVVCKASPEGEQSSAPNMWKLLIRNQLNTKIAFR
jgi:hypothetical protein